MADPREEERLGYHVGEDEGEAEEKRLHPEFLADMPPAPPDVIASHFDGTSPEEAGHLPEEEEGS